MTIYIDQLGHLISDTGQEDLHQFARSIGLRRSWYQDKKRWPHYDLTTVRAKERAIVAGAREIAVRDMVRMLRAMNNDNNNTGARQ